MSNKSKIAALAALVTVIAAPAFAGDQDLRTLQEDSGRFFTIEQTVKGTNPMNAYASAKGAAHIRAPQTHAPVQQNDFQLQGR